MAGAEPVQLRGTVVGKWRVHALLGQGGQGSVWVAKPTGTKHSPQRALKACFAEEQQARGRFEREVQLLRSCSSPNVLTVYDHNLQWIEHVPGLPAFAYYVSEKCRGSLEQKRAELGDVKRRIEIFRQACAAVTHLHSLPDPVIHRDIKPANFLISDELSSVVLADFGIARLLSSSDLTQVFEVVGTPYYRSPEVLHGDRGTVQSDVYCMGRLLEWLLTGDVSQDMSTRPVPRGIDLDDQACDVLDRIIVKSTQVSAANRFRSVHEISEQLPELWLSLRPKPLTGAVPSRLEDPGEILRVGLELAQKPDPIGWRRLEHQLRRELAPGLLQWRADNERLWSGDRNKDVGYQTTDKILDVALGRMALAFAGVYSGNPIFVDQRPILDDFLSVSGWNRGGTTAIIAGPRALVYLTHYIHGALCLSQGQTDLAIQFAEASVSDEDSADRANLWQQRDLTGWPRLLGGDCRWAWEYLRELYDRRPVFQQLFALKSDFELGLASYSVVLSLLNLATIASREGPGELAPSTKPGLLFPPLFVGLDSATLTAAVRRTSGDRNVVQRIAERTGANVTTMQQMWSPWKDAMSEFRRGVSDRWAYLRDLPLGELG